jgi:acyl carrier protein
MTAQDHEPFLKRSDLMVSVEYRAPEDEPGRILAGIWQNILRIDRIGLDDDFFEIGGDSLGASVLSGEIEARFGCKFSPSQMIDASTVAAQLEYIKTQKSAAGPVPSNLIICHAAGKKNPLFIVHGAVGFTIYDRRFLDGIDTNQPVVFIEAPGLDGKEAPLDSIEAMASSYLAAMRQVAPEGNWLLAANCAGGLVAMEMCRQAEASGETVSRLMLIDPGSHLFKTRWQTLKLRWKKFFRAPLPKKLRDQWKTLRKNRKSPSGSYEASLDERERRQSRLERRIQARTAGDSPLVSSQTAYSAEAMRHVSRSFGLAVQNHVAPEYRGRLFVLRSADSRRDDAVLSAYLPLSKTRRVPYGHQSLFTAGLSEVRKFMTDVIAAESWETFIP